MYERLAEVLTKLGETDTEIHKAFILKIGCVRLLLSEKSATSTNDLTGEELAGPYSDSYMKIVEALKKHPNIFDVAVPSDSEAFCFMLPSSSGVLVHGIGFSLRVNLPARLQEYHQEFFSDRKPIEEFEVVSSGCLFAAFAGIQDYPTWTHIGHEYRSILQTQIERETDFESPPLGPSPVHPDIYFVFRKKRNGVPPAGMRVYAIKDDVFIVLDEEDQTEKGVARSFFLSVEMSLLDFYSAQLSRGTLLDRDSEISALFSDLSSATTELQVTAWWRVLKSAQLARTGKKCLSSVHTRIVDFETLHFHFQRERLQLMEQIRQHVVLSEIQGYFDRHTEPDCEIPQSLCPALEHFDGELQTFGNIRSVVFATLLGAGVGSFLTALLS